MEHHNKTAAIIAIIIGALLLIIIAALISFCEFTAIGYRMSVPHRSSFEKVDDNVYVNRLDPDEADEKEMMIELIDSAKDRVKEFFGDLEGEDSTVIILCDDAKMLKKLGGDHDTKTTFFPSKKNYISISPDYCNTDVLAHELTHAELHSRLNASALKKLPSWFDEGLAMQNDYRKQYNEDVWAELTDNGKNTVALEDMDEPEEFYAGTEDDRQLRYACAKHEVGNWLERHGQQGLLDLIDKLNSGEDFDTAYNQ